MKKTILIIGLGLIGSSLALCIKKQHPESKIIGLDYQAVSELFALKRGIIDEVAENIEVAAPQADMIILCSPISETLKQLRILKQLPLKPSVIITDAGSTKKAIVECAHRLQLTNFVGGHPMAGSHKSGVTAAEIRLFENAYYIFIVETQTDKENVAALQELLTGTHAKFITMTAAEHDQITGMLSHLPHIIAAGLVNQSKIFNEAYPRSRQLAAGGFRDITRIASSDPKMWTDILLSNRQPLIQLLTNWQEEMAEVITWLESENQPAITAFFEAAKETRNQLPVHQEGAIPAFYDLFVDIPDQPGVIAEVTHILGVGALSLINIKILVTREEITGILQLSFRNQTDVEKAKQLIEAETSYSCYEE